MGPHFVIQIDYALDQRAQDNKFVESGLRNWVLANMGYHNHRFKESFNENTKTNGRRSFNPRSSLLISGNLFLYM